MRAWLTAKLRFSPRLPLFGAALAAVAGIGAAELWRLHFVPTPATRTTTQAATALGFVVLAFLWLWQRRPPCFWGALATGYAALHLFASDPVAATTLARVIASPINAIATGHDPSHGTAHVLHAVGTVLDNPRLVPPSADLPTRPAGPTWRFTCRLENAEIDDQTWPCHADVAVTWRDALASLSPGDRLQISALAENLQPPRNPGEPDRAARGRHQGILSEIRLSGVADARLLPPAPGLFPAAPLRRLAGSFHRWMERTLALDLADAPEPRAVVATTLLGLSNPPGLGDLENVFQRTGTLHYFAIDGLKLGLVSFLLLRALAALGVRRPWTGLLVLPLLLAYAFATGLSTASARALVVAAVLAGGELVDRPTRPLNSLGAAAAFLLAIQPQSLFDLGFQLTFCVMLAILWLVQPLTGWLARLGAPDPFLPSVLFSPVFRAREWFRTRTCGLVAVSAAAWVGSLPLMFVTFHLCSPISLVANVVTFPFAFAVLALGVLSLAAAALSTTAAVWFNNANWLCAKIFLWLVRTLAALPGGSFAVPSPENWHFPAPTAELIVYDFDRGRAASLRAGNIDWLLDAARPAEYAGGVLPCLRAHAVERLTGGLLLTQGDADHLAAARLVLADLHPARIAASALPDRSPVLRDFRKLLALRHAPEARLRQNNVLPLGAGVQGTVLYPPDDLSGKFRAAADRALVLQIEASGWRVLLLTEGSGAAARWLVSHPPSGGLARPILITAAPVSPDLLAALQPRLLILRPPIVKETADGLPPSAKEEAPLPAGLPTLVQRDSGAVTLLIYPEHLQATGFVDGRQVRQKP